MEKSPFIPEQIYNRRKDIHSIYGGNWQSGISPSSNHPYIFIFSGKSGHQHGYEDGWDNPNVFSYTGEGQSGDMEFTRGNLALRDHKQNGKRVFLFESASKGYEKLNVKSKYLMPTILKHMTHQVLPELELNFFLKELVRMFLYKQIYSHKLQLLQTLWKNME